MPMLDTLVEIIWNPKNKGYFVEKGCIFTKYGDSFSVRSIHISSSSKILVSFQCDFCNEVKLKPRNNIRYPELTCCNDECRKKYDRKRVSFICPICETPFERNTTQMKKNKLKVFYCSHACSTKVNKKDISKWIVVKCLQCDEDYELLKSQYEKFGSKFCSVPCRNKWDSENKRGSNHQCFKAESTPCTHCGNYNPVNQSTLKRQENHFCNTECRQKWYSEVWSQTPEWKEESAIRAVNMLSDGVFNHTDTECQKVLNGILDNLNIEYANEYNCKYVSIDNYLPSYNLMIEVMGTYWHTDPRFYPLIEYQRQVDRITNDKRKQSYIKNKYGIQILYLWEYDLINDPLVCEKLIMEYINNKGLLDNYHSLNYVNNLSELQLNGVLINPYFLYDIKEIRDIIVIRDGEKRSLKQEDKWITFNCDNCGEEKEQLLSHYEQSKSHCCSLKCAHEFRKGKKYSKIVNTYI